MSLLDIRHLVHDAPEHPAPHAHAEGQLFTVRAGMVSVMANGGRWIMPPGCLGWVPPMMSHGAAYHGQMRGLSLYFDESWSKSTMPADLRVVRFTPLLAALLDEISSEPGPTPAQLPAYLQVFADAFCRQTAQTLFLPMPQEPRLVRLATQMLQQPDDANDLDDWAQQIGMARRTLTRRFQQETGWSLGQWRQQMRLLLALEQLAAGQSVTNVALSLGYQSVSAFISMFRQYLGTTPKAWLAAAGS